MKFATNPVIAHRGAFKAMNLPENSIAALKQAIQLGCAGSEFDVWMTADDSLVVNHDPVFDKMDIETTAYGKLASIPLANGEKLPLLRNFLLAGMEGNDHTRLVLEIKQSRISKDRQAGVVAGILALIKELKAERYITYISFDYSTLLQIIELDKSAQTQYLNGDKSPQELAADRISGADYHYSVFRKHPEWIESAKQLRLTLNAWTVNDPAEMDWFISKGFDFITTNEPELLLQKSNRN
ncbi:MAG TPA: glycerophosphodiester phosphodiesterase family protein [Chitinophagaceae bacterium]